MAYAYIQTPGNGTNRLFSVSFPFIVRAHVKVYLGYDVAAGTGTELVDGTGFSWLSNTQIQTTVAPALGTTLTVIRKTPNGSQLVVWAPGSPPASADLNTADLQSLYVIQEQADLTASAVTTAAAAAAASNAAVEAVAAALPYQPIAAVANIPASPTANQRIEISNTTGLGSFTPLSGKPAGFVGGTDVKARLIYGTPTAAAWNWVDYFPVDPDGRYATIAAASTAQTTASNAGTAAANAQTTADSALAKTGRNRIINGSFDIWQNGTTFTGNEYGADQWLHACIGTTHTVTRQQFTLGQTAVPGEPEYFCRTVVNSVGGASNYSVLFQPLEGVRTFAGQQVAVSFKAKANATRSIAIELLQKFGTGGSPSTDVTGIGASKVSIGTSWQEVTATITVPSISGKTLGTDNNDSLQLIIWFDAGSNFNSRTSTLGQQSGTFDIAQVQIVPGPIATSFDRRPIGVELALCQRYYWTRDTVEYVSYQATGNGFRQHIGFPVAMRAVPNISFTNTSYLNANSVAAGSVTPNGFNYGAICTTAGAVQVISSIAASARL